TVNGYEVYASWALVGIIGSIFVTIVNYIGVKFAAFLQMVLTIIITIIGLLLIFGASFNGSIVNAEPFLANGWIGIVTVAIMTPFMFVGFVVIPQTAEEMNMAAISIGKIFILFVVFFVFWYIAIIVAVGFGLDRTTMIQSTLPTADAMASVFKNDMFVIVLILGGIAGIITSWNAFIIGGSRILYAMAEKKMIPAWFGKLHPKYGTRTRTILLIGLLTTPRSSLGRPLPVWYLQHD